MAETEIAQLSAPFTHPATRVLAGYAEGYTDPATRDVATREALSTPPSDKVLLDTLRSEMISGTPRDQVILQATLVARIIGDRRITEQDAEVGAWITEKDTGITSASSGEARKDATEHEGGTYNDQEGHVHVIDDSLKELQRRIRNGAEETKIELEPGDEELLALITHAGHEGAHGLLTVTDYRLAYDKEPAAKHMEGLAIGAYLARHPERRMTGNIKDDIHSFEERFTEGYALMVAESALRALGYYDKGYSEQQLNRLLDWVATNTPISGERGANPIDHIRHASVRKSPADIAAEHTGTAPNYGMLGYGLPLAPGDLLKTTRELAGLQRYSGRELEQTIPTSWLGKMRWYIETRLNRQRTTKDHLARLATERAAYLGGDSTPR